MSNPIKKSIKDIIKRLKLDNGKWVHTYINCYKINKTRKENYQNV
jgi:ribosomal protein L18E